MMMNRCHSENTLACEFERSDLQYDRYRFHNEHTAHNEKNNFMAHDNSDQTQRSAQRQCADIAHKNLRGIGVEPEKAKTCTNKRTTKNNQFPGAGHIRKIQIQCKFYVAH